MSNRRGGLVVRAPSSWVGIRGSDPRPRQTKVFQTGSSGFTPPPPPPPALRIMGIALRLAHQWQDNGLFRYWLEVVQETWICELLPLNNWNIVDTA